MINGSNTFSDISRILLGNRIADKWISITDTNRDIAVGIVE